MNVQPAIGMIAFALVLGACTVSASAIPSRSGLSPSTQSSADASGPASAGAEATPFDTASAEQYCTEQDGMLVERVPTWNTNADPSARPAMGAPMTFCEFEMGEGDQTTRISVDLVTLYSEGPTLAGVAYLSRIPVTLPPEPSANPAEYNCRVGLDGTSDFGNTAAGGGWVNQSVPTFVVMDECVFADMSAIDEFGIFYYANGTIRGADLATKMRYQPGNKLPALFEAPPRS
jgi:hypothetical protein